MTEHLAVYSRNKSRDYIELMLNGQKTTDIKLSDKRIAPYNKLEKGDRVYIKEAAGPVVGTFKVGEVAHYEFKDPQEIYELLITIWQTVGLATMQHLESMYQRNQFKRYGTVFEITEPVRMPPLKVFKRDRRVWVPDWKPPFDLEPSIEQFKLEQEQQKNTEN